MACRASVDATRTEPNILPARRDACRRPPAPRRVPSVKNLGAHGGPFGSFGAVTDSPHSSVPSDTGSGLGGRATTWTDRTGPGTQHSRNDIGQPGAHHPISRIHEPTSSAGGWPFSGGDPGTPSRSRTATGPTSWLTCLRTDRAAQDRALGSLARPPTAAPAVPDAAPGAARCFSQLGAGSSRPSRGARSSRAAVGGSASRVVRGLLPAYHVSGERVPEPFASGSTAAESGAVAVAASVSRHGSRDGLRRGRALLARLTGRGTAGEHDDRTGGLAGPGSPRCCPRGFAGLVPQPREPTRRRSARCVSSTSFATGLPATASPAASTSSCPSVRVIGSSASARYSTIPRPHRLPRPGTGF